MMLFKSHAPAVCSNTFQTILPNMFWFLPVTRTRTGLYNSAYVRLGVSTIITVDMCDHGFDVHIYSMVTVGLRATYACMCIGVHMLIQAIHVC